MVLLLAICHQLLIYIRPLLALVWPAVMKNRHQVIFIKGSFYFLLYCIFINFFTDDALCVKKSLRPLCLLTLWVLCGPLLTVAPSQPTITQPFLSSYLPGVVWFSVTCRHVIHTARPPCFMFSMGCWLLLYSPTVVYGRGSEVLVHRQPEGGFSSGFMCGVRGIAWLKRHRITARAG